MRRISMLLAGAVMAVAGTVATTLPATAAATPQSASWPPVTRAATAHTGTVKPGSVVIAPGTIRNCPKKYACMFTEDGWAAAVPEHEYFNYKCYNLTDEYNDRMIANNQIDGAIVAGYSQKGCAGSRAWTVNAGKTKQVNITPIDSIALIG